MIAVRDPLQSVGVEERNEEVEMKVDTYASQGFKLYFEGSNCP